MKNILILCTGNICRSPMAEGLFRAQYAKDQYNITSAGLAAMVGSAPAPFACEIMLEKKNIDISAHRAKQVTNKCLLESDMIFVMDQHQKKNIEFHLSVLYGRVFRLGQWSQFDIIDPYKRSKKTFEQTFVLLEQCLKDWQNHL